MPNRLPMRDVIILIPGICGSVLSKDDREVWAPSSEGVWNFIKSASHSLNSLHLEADDPAAVKLGDGVTATRLVDDIHIVPGLWKIDGYTSIRKLLARHFQLYSSHDMKPGEANYVELPYDWRRDNRFSARTLDQAVNLYLTRWRELQNLPDARVLILAHSMGGLVARHWLEVMGGWQRTRALVTFGTPFRGSPKALGYLANGSKPKLASLTSLLRSCTSVYQLLPIYPMLHSGTQWARVAETPAIPNVNQAKAEAALRFHRDIEEASRAPKSAGSYALLPFVGTGQPTLQSANISVGAVTITDMLPQNFDPLWFDGDGTVPYASAIPIEMSLEPRLGYICEQHGSIQNNNRVLDYLYDFLRRTQTSDLSSVRSGVVLRDKAVEQPGISLKLDDFFDSTDDIELSVSLLNTEHRATNVEVSIEPTDMQAEQRNYVMAPHYDHWFLRVGNLPTGAYRAHVRARLADGLQPPPVTGLFEVAD